MKKFCVLLLVLLWTLSLSACGKTVEVDTASLTRDVLGADGLFEAELILVTEEVVNSVVGVDTADCESVEYYLGTATTGEEYGIFVCTTEEDAQAVKTALETHNADYQAQYASYSPQYVPLIENAVIRQEGRYVVYLAASDSAQAQSIVETHFG